MDTSAIDFLQQMMDQIQDVIWIVNEDGEIVSVNQAAEACYGYSSDEIKTMRVQDFRLPESTCEAEEQEKRDRADGSLIRTWHRRRSGEIFPVEINSRIVRHADRVFVISVIRDISRRQAMASEQKMHRQLERQNLMLTLVNQMALDLMRRRDLEEVLETVANSAARLLNTPNVYVCLANDAEAVFERKIALGGFAKEGLERIPFGKGLVGVASASEEVALVSDYNQFEGRVFSLRYLQEKCLAAILLKSEVRILGAMVVAVAENGRLMTPEEADWLRRIAEIASRAIEDALVVQSYRKELTERRETEETIRRMAYRDSLTGLFNRARLIEHLSDEMTRARRTGVGGAVLFIDVDEFKAINNNFGHAYGDEIIRRIAADIADQLGEGSLVSRLCGDEFIAVAAGVAERERIEPMAESLINRIYRYYDMGLCRLPISASIGIALYPQDASSAEELLECADMALYEAKRRGKNMWWFFAPEQHKEIYNHMLLKQELREAINRSELSLVFQPLLDTQTIEVVAFEALLRWNSRQFGEVAPDRFIPLAEESGAIKAIGEWVIRNACAFAGRLRRMGREDLRVTVNISVRQLAEEDFISMLLREILEAGIDNKQIEIEFTETALVDSMGDHIAKLVYLRAAEIQLTLDDFGKGYSSLAYLKDLPVITIKIDKEFIEDIAVDPERRRFVQSIIHMAHEQNLYVTAEGVETAAQYEILRQCRCDYFQGYLFSRPVAQEEAIKLLEPGRPCPMEYLTVSAEKAD